MILTSKTRGFSGKKAKTQRFAALAVKSIVERRRDEILPIEQWDKLTRILLSPVPVWPGDPGRAGLSVPRWRHMPRS